MNLRFAGKRISSLVAVVPKNERLFDDEVGYFNFAKANSMKLKQVMGFKKHRLAEDGVCASDLCLRGLEYLFEQGALRRDEIDALLFVSQSPDHFIPPTSNIIQGRAGLGTDVLCMDINQGCAGFVVGLIQAFTLLNLPEIRKVVLLNGDTLSKKVSRRDRNIYPMIGDAGSVTVVERDPAEETVWATINMDGSRSRSLEIPAGGFRMPSSPETAVEELVDENNYRSRDQFHMDGPAVFNFVQTTVPPMIDALLGLAGASRESVDYFLFHQPNKFMLQKLADKMKVPREKMPGNVVEEFGNASSVTIPTNIAFNLGDRLHDHVYTVCLAGFGVGLTWTSMLMNLGNLSLCRLIEV